jgi:hypothetical protein
MRAGLDFRMTIAGTNRKHSQESHCALAGLIARRELSRVGQSKIPRMRPQH